MRNRTLQTVCVSGLTSGLALLMLSACSSGGGSDVADRQQGKGTDAPAQTAKPAEPVNLVFFGNSTQTEQYFNTYYGDALRKKFPDYKFTYIQKNTPGGIDLPGLVASKTQIDIFYATVGNFESSLVAYDLHVDMEPYMKKLAIDTSRLEPSQLEAMKLNTGGRIYGLPVQSNVETLYYNKAIFDKFGVAYPLDGLTWDELAEMSGKLTRRDGDKPYYGFGTTFDHILKTNPFSLARVDPKTEKPTIDSDPRWKTFYDTVFVRTMRDEAYRQSYNSGGKLNHINSFLKDQNVALFPYMAQLYLTNPEELKTMEWDIATYPTFKELPQTGSQALPMYFGVTKLSKHPDAAAEVLKYMVSDEYQLTLARKGWMPSVMTAEVQKQYAQDTPFPDKNYAALFKHKPAPIAYAPEYDPQLMTVYTVAASDLVKGVADMNTIFRQAAEKAAKIVEEAKAK